MANCPSCGCYVSSGAKYCPSCGGKINRGDAPAADTPAAIPQNWYENTAPAVPAPPVPEEEYFDPGPGVREVWARAAGILAGKPLRLWGMSLLCTLLVALASVLAFVPLIALPIVFVLYVGMESIYLEGLYGAEPSSPQLFKGFRKGCFLRWAAGMGWMSLWVLIWGLIPIAGPFIAVARLYSYRFVPYIMLSDPEVNAFDALRRSMDMTRSFRLRMFLADALALLAIVAVLVVLALLSGLDYIGFVFGLLMLALLLAAAALLPLFLGLTRACFYDEIEKMM